MDEKRSSKRPEQRRKRTPEEIAAMKRRKARARWEEAIRDSENNREERPIRHSNGREGHNRSRTASERPRNASRNQERIKRGGEPPRRRYSEDERGQRIVKSPKSSQNRKRKKFRRISLKKKIIFGVCGILALFIIMIASTLIGFFSKIENNCSVEAVSPGRNEVVNILVLGLDIGDAENQGNAALKRTDTMLLVSYNPSNKNTTVVSIPRDTLINGEEGRYKINAAYPMGGDSKVISVVEELLPVDINYLVKIDYEAFRGIVDAIGGVEMKIEQDMFYDDDGQNLHINFKGGTTVLLDGEKAEEFFRWRKNNDGTGLATGDLGRIENQHKFINKLVSKLKSPSTIFKANKILNCIAENIDTNMSGSAMVKYGLKIMSSKMNITTLQGAPQMIGGLSYLVADESKNTELYEALRGNDADMESLVKPEVKILIENGTNRTGLAGRAKGLLEKDGWGSVEVGNGDLTRKSIIMTTNESYGEMLEETLGDMKVTTEIPDKEKYTGYDIVIILGDNYNK